MTGLATTLLTLILMSLPSGVFAAVEVAPEALFKGCADLKSLRPTIVSRGAQVEFVNKTKKTVTLFSIDSKDVQREHVKLPPDKDASFNPARGEMDPRTGAAKNWENRVWKVVDGAGHCLGAFVASEHAKVTIREPEAAARDWGTRAAYDLVPTYGGLNNPSFDCFRRFEEYDLKKTQTLYTNAIIFCTALTSVIGYDLKRKYD
jgi:hypothetical protein